MYENDFSFVRLFRAYGRILDFKGRSTRTELIGYWIATWLVSTVFGYFTVFGGMVFGADRLFLAGLVNVLLLIPAPALAVRRAHDIGWPSNAALLLIVPAGAAMIFGEALEPYPTVRVFLSLTYFGGIVMLLWKPQDCDNAYGPDPRLVDERYGQEQ